MANKKRQRSDDENNDEESNRPSRKVRHQVDPEQDHQFLHRYWRELGEYADDHGNVATVRRFRCLFNVGNERGQRTEAAAAKIVGNYRRRYRDPDQVADRRRKKKGKVVQQRKVPKYS